MNYPQFSSDLYRLYQSEVYGAATFAAAAKYCRNPEKKAKLMKLMLLEEQTKVRVLKYVERHNLHVRYPHGWALRGKIEGLGMNLAPWSFSMKQILKATTFYYEIFTRLYENADVEDREFFAYVMQHEEALKNFAQRELDGTGNSLQATELLLS